MGSSQNIETLKKKKILGVPAVFWLFPPVALILLVSNLLNKKKITHIDEQKIIIKSQEEKE